MTAAERHYTLLFRRERPTRPILECYLAAKRHIHFRADLSASVKAHKSRSRAAKKGWAKRATA